MKLLFCRECRDVFRLWGQQRRCSCGRSKGRYLSDGHHAKFSGPCIPIGIANTDLADADRRYPKKPTAIRMWTQNGNPDFSEEPK